MTEPIEQERVVPDTLRSGLKITLMDEAVPLCARVSWIEWDSGFRDSGLEVGDRIVAMNGTALALPEEDRARRLARDRMIGGLQEAAVLAGAGLGDGSALTLTVLRRNLPGRGWKRMDVKGTVRAERFYYDKEGRPALAPGGPARLANDGFGEAWLTWFERRSFDWESILDGRWFGTLDNRHLLDAHLEERARVDAALRSYPGPFSKRLEADFDSVAESLRGRAAPLPADALAFRGESEAREKEVAALGDQAFSDFLVARGAVESLPQLDLVRDDRKPLAGQVIALEKVSWRGAVTDGDKSIFAAEHSGYDCFIATDQPAMQRFWERQADYQARVEPRLPESYDIVGRIAPGTRLVIGGRGAVIGLDIEVLAVRAPEHFFADVSGAATTFAGAERAGSRGAAMPANGASPSDVMRAYVAAVKAGDEQVWRALYADWTAMGGEGMPLYRAFDPYTNYLPDFTRSRDLMLHDVCHAEPFWESEPRAIIDDRFVGVPKVEEVTVVMDHIGRFDDGDRVFCKLGLNRVWQLQRRDQGPWRIASHNVL